MDLVACQSTTTTTTNYTLKILRSTFVNLHSLWNTTTLPYRPSRTLGAQYPMSVTDKGRSRRGTSPRGLVIRRPSLSWRHVLLITLWASYHSMTRETSAFCTSGSFHESGSSWRRQRRQSSICVNREDHEDTSSCHESNSSWIADQPSRESRLLPSFPRRQFLHVTVALSSLGAVSSAVPPASVAAPFLTPFLRSTTNNDNDLYVLGNKRGNTNAANNTQTSMEYSSSSSSSLSSTKVIPMERLLLQLLPVKNKFFRDLETHIDNPQMTSILQTGGGGGDTETWKLLSKDLEMTIGELDRKRGLLEPVFNEQDNALLQITKAERGEQLIDALRNSLVDLQTTIKQGNATAVSLCQTQALLALASVGELLVSTYPYNVPTEGKFSYLPRLLGRCKVTFVMRRNNKVLGNVTILADGFAAPITAGNFVDLSLRNFYTGLPIKFTKKRLGRTGSEFEVASIPILGSYNEGFYDPLTAQLRRLPLELIRIEKSSGLPTLAYSQGLSSLQGTATLEPAERSNPKLSFETPGLVAMNHPDKNLNGASTEFFSLQKNSMMDEKRTLLNGEFAPFGYIIEGYDLYQTLQPNDIIDSTTVDEWGQLNLVKIRQSSFSEVVQGGEDEDTNDEKNSTATGKSKNATTL